MLTVAAEWESFQRMAFPPGAQLAPGQLRVMRQAFYAGARAAQRLVLTFSEYEEDVGVQMLDTLDQELTSFCAEVVAGRA